MYCLIFSSTSAEMTLPPPENLRSTEYHHDSPEDGHPGEPPLPRTGNDIEFNQEHVESDEDAGMYEGAPESCVLFFTRFVSYIGKSLPWSGPNTGSL